MIKIRFRNFPGDKSYGHFAELVELATGEKTIIISDTKINVDLEITGPYNSQSDNFKTPFSTRLRTIRSGRSICRSKDSIASQVNSNRFG